MNGEVVVLERVEVRETGQDVTYVKTKKDIMIQDIQRIQ